MEGRGGEVAGGRKGELGRISALQRKTAATSQKDEEEGSKKPKRGSVRGCFISRQRKVAGRKIGQKYWSQKLTDVKRSKQTSQAFGVPATFVLLLDMDKTNAGKVKDVHNSARIFSAIRLNFNRAAPRFSAKLPPLPPGFHHGSISS